LRERAQSGPAAPGHPGYARETTAALKREGPVPRDKGSGLLLVMMDVDPEHEDEFNRWYDEEHFPERVACPGFVAGRRFRAIEGGPRYLAYYELESPQVLEGEAYRRIYPPSEWTLRVRRHLRTSIRNVYQDITPAIPPGYQVRAKR
jgi:hypothetical protein